jgi:hypothetical protein
MDRHVKVSHQVAAIIRHLDVPGLLVDESDLSVKIIVDDLPETIDSSVSMITQQAGSLLKRIDIASEMLRLLHCNIVMKNLEGITVAIEDKAQERFKYCKLAANIAPLKCEAPYLYFVPYATILNSDYNELNAELMELQSEILKRRTPINVLEKEECHIDSPVKERQIHPAISSKNASVSPSKKIHKKKKNLVAKPSAQKSKLQRQAFTFALPHMDEVSDEDRRTTLSAVDIFAAEPQSPSRIKLSLFADKREQSLQGDIEYAFCRLKSCYASSNITQLMNGLGALGRLLKSAPDAYELSEEVTSYMLRCKIVVKRLCSLDELLSLADEGIKLWDTIEKNAGSKKYLNL